MTVSSPISWLHLLRKVGAAYSTGVATAFPPCLWTVGFPELSIIGGIDFD
jgi:hypothetical protein